VLYFALMTGLNILFGLGQRVDLQQALQAFGGSSGHISPNILLPVIALQMIVEGPIIGIMYGFGEEYGWRGFLQEQLVRIGKRRGILLLGLIWSVWHYPVIWMGHNYPGYPLLGTLMMTVFTTSLAFILGYAMLKTGSIWLVAFLHGINNQTVAFFQAMVYAPSNPILSFNAGVFGLIAVVLVALALLRDPIWNDEIQTPKVESVRTMGEEAGAA
jgi:membrane protease YdiL (CAAX protease family)